MTCQLGVYDPSSDQSSWSGFLQFNGTQIKTATHYHGWDYAFPTAFAQTAWNHAAITYVNMEPWHDFNGGFTPLMSDIQAGVYDSYLTQWANDAFAFGHPVFAAFAHEMNGYWYPWGNGGSEGVTPTLWVATWQHVVSLISAIAANVTWVWAPNIEPGVGPVAPYWPGSSYVGLAGFDGYLQTQTDTYAQTIASTVTSIQALTAGPIWLAETGIPAGTARASRITQYVADIQNAGLYGLSWFNQSPYNLTADEIAAFDAAVNSWNSVQPQWAWCGKCKGLFYGPNTSSSSCPAGGTHDGTNSYDYFVSHNVSGSGWQTSWAWCHKCQGMFYGPNTSSSHCPAGGTHDGTGSFNYSLFHGSAPLGSQSSWDWCSKCQGLFYGPQQSSSHCPAGGTHSGGSSYNYSLGYTTSS